MSTTQRQTGSSWCARVGQLAQWTSTVVRKSVPSWIGQHLRKEASSFSNAWTQAQVGTPDKGQEGVGDCPAPTWEEGGLVGVRSLFLLLLPRVWEARSLR